MGEERTGPRGMTQDEMQAALLVTVTGEDAAFIRRVVAENKALRAHVHGHPTREHIWILVALVFMTSLWGFSWLLLHPAVALFGTLACNVLALTVWRSSLPTNQSEEIEGYG